MAMGVNLGGKQQSEMNVTPMIDILLVLIIICMIIRPTSKTTGLDALAPQPADINAPFTPDRSVVLQLVRLTNGTTLLRLNRQEVRWEDLRGRLFDIYKIRAERILFVSADSDLPFEDVAAAVDTARAAFPDIKVGLMTRPA